MFLDSFTWGSAQSFYPRVETWEVCLAEPTAGLLKEWTEARKEASIPLKCTDNWIPMGCSWRACCDGWVTGPSCRGNITTRKRSNHVVPMAALICKTESKCAYSWCLQLYHSWSLKKLYFTASQSSALPPRVQNPFPFNYLISTRLNFESLRMWLTMCRRNHTRIWGIYEWGRRHSTSCTKTVQRFITAACRVLWFILSRIISQM